MAYTSLKSAPKAFDQHKRLIVVQVAAVTAIVLLLFAKPFLSEGSSGHELMETAGFGFVLVCFLGRLWSILYVGGRKNDELVVSGPFSMSRNPLYFFSIIGAVGIGLMFGSVLAAAMLGLASFLVFRFTAGREASSAPPTRPMPSGRRVSGRIRCSTATRTTGSFPPAR
ncbi:isoprenylcysteine carboxylmethyltransferase family protein [Mesorhizobium sp. AA23]|uniref:methyltransferase family protein n=1 Tax=Mesorhizobium sp. AA23 TaxID=1854058 RepID=UPI000B09E04D|nr:isoprenylcysteine carboxylmethyltransferase family protein [Mesorhizobium sp. AA23]